jgi:hypothetical protein
MNSTLIRNFPLLDTHEFGTAPVRKILIGHPSTDTGCERIPAQFIAGFVAGYGLIDDDLAIAAIDCYGSEWAFSDRGARDHRYNCAKMSFIAESLRL